MTFSTALRLNMTGLQPDPRDEAKRYRAALDMAAYVDAHGFDAVALEEHHGAGNGWLPSPLTMAAAIAARWLGVRQVVPMHWGTFPLLTGTPQALEHHLEGSGIQVLALKPGETAE